MGSKRAVRFLASKKAMDIDLWFNLFELVIVFLVGVVLLDAVNNEINNNAFGKNYLARDTALMIGTLYSAPGDVEINYPDKIPEIGLNIRQNTISALAPGELESEAETYPFAEDKNYLLAYIKSPASYTKIIYRKIKSNIDIIFVPSYNTERSGSYGGAGASGTT